ncbi:MAG TPA: RNA polymerase sigma factor [Thermoanaerobaculia bacterium]|nr:RNA polymerase sigma factor [Thermoanaerobaculia bacterium]
MNSAAQSQPTPTDSTLMERVRSGDLEQLSELFERHHRRLYQFFLKLARDRSVAEDLVQEVFVRVLKYRHTWRDEAEFVPWMFALARNAAVDHFRSRTRDSKRDAAALPDLTTQPAHAVERLEELERATQLRAALDLLAPDKREVLLLARFGELRHDRIAAMLGISPGAVRVRLHRALKELREAYRQVTAEELP